MYHHPGSVQIFLATAVFATQVNWLTADIFSSPALSKVNDVAADAGILFSAATTNSSAAPGAAIIASGDGSPRGAGRQRVSLNGNVVTVSRSPSAPSLLPPPPVNNHRSKATTATWCDEGYVDCEFGFVKGSDPAIKCAQACGTQCCVGFYACDRFTGKVCKDGNSCMGRIACGAANIPSVVKSCNGKQACYYVGGNSSAIGQVGRMENSCNWDYSCRFLGGGGFFLYRGGQISGPGKRDVGNVVNSCNGYTACEMAGENGGSIGNITNSCNAPRACIRLGHPEGSVGHVTDSCNDVSACARVGAQNGGSIGNITKSCNAPDACRLAGYNDCYGDDDGLFDDGLFDDHDDCWLSTSASSPSCGQVTSNLNECCNKADECLGKEEVDLPAECRFSTLKVSEQQAQPCPRTL